MVARAVKHVRANVVAYLALMIAIAGVPTAWAVSANSVGSKQIKPNAVKSSDIANNTITGKDVNEGTLGEVPNASSADDAGNAQTLGGLEPSTFLRSSLVTSGAGDPSAVPAQTILSLPSGLQVKTDGDSDLDFTVVFSYSDGRSFSAATPDGGGFGSNGAGVATYTPPMSQDTFMITDTVDVAHPATIWCAKLHLETGPIPIVCSALQPPD